jgi:hypothetical protein
LEAKSFFDATGPNPTPRPISLADFMCFPCSAADRFRVSLLFLGSNFEGNSGLKRFKRSKPLELHNHLPNLA